MMVATVDSIHFVAHRATHRVWLYVININTIAMTNFNIESHIWAYPWTELWTFDNIIKIQLETNRVTSCAVVDLHSDPLLSLSSFLLSMYLVCILRFRYSNIYMYNILTWVICMIIILWYDIICGDSILVSNTQAHATQTVQTVFFWYQFELIFSHH